MQEVIFMEEYINGYIRPRLQGDGGEITFVERNGDVITVLLQGECSKCLILDRCLAWIEERIAVDLGEKVRVEGIRKKPYFQDV
jgi:Fe-S cluster biogenesis protein NfuA